MKKIFEKALNDYKFIKHLLDNYSGDYDSLISNANGRKIDNERYDIDVNNVTITLVRTEGNKVRWIRGPADRLPERFSRDTIPSGTCRSA